MASIVQEGPFSLAIDEIGRVVTQKSPGSFVLGTLDHEGNFKPHVVGRAVNDVRRELELQARLGAQYSAFKFRYAASPREAFHQQCCDFHECGGCVGLENKKHPARPSHTDWLCPICGDKFLEQS